jgi:hypothetical protein
MSAASAGWDMACRIIGACRFGAPIDREIGDMVLADDMSVNCTGPKQFTYVRYDPDVSRGGLDALGLSTVKAENVQVMDSVAHIRDIQHVGATYAQKYVRLSHLRPFIGCA